MLLAQLTKENCEKLCKILEENGITPNIKEEKGLKNIFVNEDDRISAIKLFNKFQFDAHEPKKEKERKQKEKDLAFKIGVAMGMFK